VVVSCTFGCLVHFLRLSAVWWPGTQSVRVNNLLACIFAKYSPIFLKRQSRLFETEAVEFTSLANKNIGLSMSLLLHQLSTLAPVKAVISGHLVQSVLTSYFRLFGSKAKTSFHFWPFLSVIDRRTMGLVLTGNVRHSYLSLTCKLSQTR